LTAVLVFLLAVPGVVGQTDDEPVTYGQFANWLDGFQGQYDADLGNLSEKISDCKEESIVPTLIEPETPESGVHVDAADEESVVNVVASNASDLVKVKASKGSSVSIVIGEKGTSQTSEDGSSATTNEQSLPTAQLAGQGSDFPVQLQGQYQDQSLEGYTSSEAGVVFAPNINCSATSYAPGQEVPVIDATSGINDGNAPQTWSWDGFGMSVQTVQHPEDVEVVSRDQLGWISYPLSSEVLENVAYYKVQLSDGGAQVVLPTDDGNIAAFSEGWVVYDNPATALSAISGGRQVTGIVGYL